MFKRKLTNYQGSWIELLRSLMSLYSGFVHIPDLSLEFGKMERFSRSRDALSLFDNFFGLLFVAVNLKIVPSIK